MTNRIQNFIDELNRQIETNLPKIDFQFNSEYGWPEFDPLRDEICKCLICDLCQAAITLTNHLLENFLKTMLIYHETIANKDNRDDNSLSISIFNGTFYGL